MYKSNHEELNLVVTSYLWKPSVLVITNNIFISTCWIYSQCYVVQFYILESLSFFQIDKNWLIIYFVKIVYIHIGVYE